MTNRHAKAKTLPVQPSRSTALLPRSLSIWAIPVLVIGLGVVAVVIFLLATPYGVALTKTDPVSYIKAAQSLAHGEGYLGFDGETVVRWPPVFPVLVAIPVWLGVEGIHALRFVNALALG